MHLSIKDVYRFFAPLVGPRCCVAGGAVRDELIGRQPRDYDVFCFGEFDQPAILRACGLTDDEVELHQLCNEYSRHKVLTVRWRGAEVQFVHSDDGRDDVDALLDRFDWNVCLFAYDGAFVKRMDERQIRKGGILRLNSNNGTVRTMRRGFKFAERYGMSIGKNDLAALCADVLSRHVDEHSELTTEQILTG